MSSARRGRPKGHTPANKGKPNQFNRLPPRTASHSLQKLFSIMDTMDESIREISKRAGCHEVTMSHWRHGKNSPRLIDIEAVANAIGYRIDIVPDDEKNSES